MLKNFVEYLIGLGNTRQEQIGNQIYTTQPVNLIRALTPEAIVVRNLSGVVEYVINNYDDQPPMLIHVSSPTEVSVFSTYNRDMERNKLIQASAMLPNIPFKSFMDAESFNILLQSCFVPNDDRAAVLAVVGNIKEENVATVGDNGISQQVTAKTGIATVGSVILPNPVKLKPFRTFVEITQPESAFVFRMQQGPMAALFEADGGAWKLEAIHGIREYLDEKLAQQINDGAVTIIS